MWSIKIQESLTAILGIVTLFCCFLLIDLYLSTCMYLSIVKWYIVVNQGHCKITSLLTITELYEPVIQSPPNLLGQNEVTHCFKASSELATFATKTIKALRVSACGKFRTET